MGTITLEIDESVCAHCGTCVRECTHGGPRVAPTASGSVRCGQCFHCFAVCPSGAIKVGSVAAQDDGAAVPSIGIKELTDFLATRRSTRRFAPDDVSVELLGKLYEAAAHIPSGGNRRSHSFTVVRRGSTRTALMAEIKRVYRTRSVLLNNPVLRRILRPFVGRYMKAFLKDPEYGGRIRDLISRMEAGEDPVFYNAPIIVVIHSRELIPTPREDSVLAGYALCLARACSGTGNLFRHPRTERHQREQGVQAHHRFDA